MHGKGAAHYIPCTRRAPRPATRGDRGDKPKSKNIQSIRHPQRDAPSQGTCNPGAFFIARLAAGCGCRWCGDGGATIRRMEWIIVSLASVLAGFVDAIVGGGGLILVPALFAVFPTTHPATLFGINKSASVWGTAFAARQYGRRVDLHWPALLPAAAAGFAGGFLGAWAVTILPSEFLRKLLPVVLLGVLAYTLARKDLGR